MPCYDPRSNVSYDDVIREQDKVIFLENQVKRLEGMLCALVNETTDDSILEKAKENGKCPDIKEWFHFHLTADVNRLVKNGLPKDHSQHELNVWKNINPIYQKKQ